MSPFANASIRVVGAEVLARADVAGDRLAVERRDRDVEPGARTHELADEQADHQGAGGDHLEVDDRFHADATQLAQVAHPGDADDHGGEDDRRDQHLHQLDEPFAQRAQRHAHARPQMAEQGADRHGDQNLDVQAAKQARRRHQPGR
jgi:hypothetical protein